MLPIPHISLVTVDSIQERRVSETMQENGYAALVSKMQQEQEVYRIWLMNQPPEVILSKAAEWSAREDLLSSLDEWTPGEKEIQGLLAAEKPLETLFGWLKNGTDEEEIRRQIDGMAAGIINMMAAGG